MFCVSISVSDVNEWTVGVLCSDFNALEITSAFRDISFYRCHFCAL